MAKPGASVGTRGRSVVTVPATVGDYGTSVDIGKPGSGQAQGSFRGVTVLIENIPALARVELWLPSVADTTTGAASSFTDSNYFYAGLVCTPARTAYSATGETASQGSANWLLSGYPGAQLRVRSGGSAGTGTISWSAL